MLDENGKNNMLNLDSHISNDCYTIEDIVVEDDSEDNIFENTDNKTHRGKSPFGRHFEKIFEFCNRNVNKYDSSNELNPSYNPKVRDYLLSYYLPLLPLWSGIILGPHSEKVGNRCDHYSNALIENWMRIIKLDIFNSKSNIRPGDFMKKLYPNIMTR